MNKLYLLLTGSAYSKLGITTQGVYDEDTLLGSDYAEHIPQKVHQTKTIIDIVNDDFNKPVEWVTTITRIK